MTDVPKDIMEELLTVSAPDHDLATSILKKHTGQEGGCPRIDWYKLRDEIAAAIAESLYDQRQRDRRALIAERERRTPDVVTDDEALLAEISEFLLERDQQTTQDERDEGERETTAFYIVQMMRRRPAPSLSSGAGRSEERG